jgi:transcriptional activator SPT8
VGQIIRRYPSHGAQLVSIGIRPISATVADAGSPTTTTLVRHPQTNGKSATDTVGARKTSVSQPGAQLGSPRSENDDYDPLFDDDPDPDAPGELDLGAGSGTRGSTTSAWRSGVPTLDPDMYERYSHNILMTAAIDGQITIWDRRVAGSAPGSGVGRLEIPEKTPPWCVSVRSGCCSLMASCANWFSGLGQACWSADGSQLYAGRRNGTVEVWDMRQMRNMHGGGPRLLRTLRNPLSSGAVSCVVAFPDGKHLAWCVCWSSLPSTS